LGKIGFKYEWPSLIAPAFEKPCCKFNAKRASWFNAGSRFSDEMAPPLDRPALQGCLGENDRQCAEPEHRLFGSMSFIANRFTGPGRVGILHMPTTE
jgi:hypothetical protein